MKSNQVLQLDLRPKIKNYKNIYDQFYIKNNIKGHIEINTKCMGQKIKIDLLKWLKYKFAHLILPLCHI